jgi:hypothetical protein
VAFDEGGPFKAKAAIKRERIDELLRFLPTLANPGPNKGRSPWATLPTPASASSAPISA